MMGLITHGKLHVANWSVLHLYVTDLITQKESITMAMLRVAENTIFFQVQYHHLLAPQNNREVSFSNI